MAEIRFEEEGEAMRVPRPMLIAAAAMVALAVGMAATARLTDTGAVRIAQAAPARAEATRELRFADRADGGVVVTDAATGQTAFVLEPGVNSFIRGAVRALAFERRKDGVGAGVPFRLSRFPGGRLVLEDPATGTVLDLAAYGPENAGAFAVLLPAAP